ncbi:MAG TPA: sugar transferase [Microbacteriaceae bacterium]|nr:sugar transferase [Microbacteriaceae bacterium]
MVARQADRDWARRYARGLTITDLLVIVWAVVGAQLLRFGVSLEDEAKVGKGGELALNYTFISVALIIAWMLVLTIFRTREARIVGAGATEYRLAIQATLWLFGLAAIVLFLFKIDIARAYVLIALPLGLIAILFERWLWRQWLGAKRRRGAYSYRAVLVGSVESVAEIARDLARAAEYGYLVTAAVSPDAGDMKQLPGTSISVSKELDSIPRLMEALEADTLVITSSDHLPPGRVRELSWGLEPGRQHLVMAPSLTDVSGPRIHMRPVAGLPLVHVETPALQGAQAFVKRAFDIVGSLVLIVLSSPLLIAIAIAIKLSDSGPILYRSERIGYRGRAFRMLKFRSMRVGADAELMELLDRQGTANQPLFKVKDDPRITRLGGFLRGSSLDELPQFLNVLGGSMSLIGPRPQVAAEVALYDAVAYRRLLLKPGITGLWQVSGRSSLSWEQAIRLDLYYVENWSVVGDLVILWRTARAVVLRRGAA